MRHAFYRIGTSGLAISAALVGCSLFSKEETNTVDSTVGGQNGSSGGSVGVGLGGGSSTPKGGATTGTSGSGNGATSGSGNGTAGETGVPAACQELVAEFAKCGGAKAEADFRTVNILLVIDKSGSMVATPQGFSTDKWTALETALKTALTKVQADINFGMILYPFSSTTPIPPEGCERDGTCCTVEGGTAAVNVPIGAGTVTVPQILAKVQDTGPGGGTPTAAALRSAYEYFSTGEGSTLQGDKFVLLATDGGPNCNPTNTCSADRCTPILDGQITQQTYCSGPDRGLYCVDDQAVISQIEMLKTKGVDTFVVGIPGTEAYASYLDQFAVAGGRTDPNPAATHDYYEVSASGGVEGLTGVFSSITTQLVRACDIALANDPPDPNKVNIAIDCTTIPQQDGEAWEIDQTVTPNILRLKGEVCTKIQETGAKRVDVFYNCPPIL
jgi:hypothetical protein